MWPDKELLPTLANRHRRKWDVFIGCSVSGRKSGPPEFPNASQQNLRNHLYVINLMCRHEELRSHTPFCSPRTGSSPSGGSAGAELLADLKCFQMLNNQQRRFFMRWNPPLLYAFGRKKISDGDISCLPLKKPQKKGGKKREVAAPLKGG